MSCRGLRPIFPEGRLNLEVIFLGLVTSKYKDWLSNLKLCVFRAHFHPLFWLKSIGIFILILVKNESDIDHVCLALDGPCDPLIRTNIPLFLSEYVGRWIHRLTNGTEGKLAKSMNIVFRKINVNTSKDVTTCSFIYICESFFYDRAINRDWWGENKGLSVSGAITITHFLYLYFFI